MNCRKLSLESFESISNVPNAHVLTSEAIEEIKLAAFERGYASGWDDCSSSQEFKEREEALLVLGNLQEVSFTHSEVKAHFISSLEKLLRAISENFLPRSLKKIMPEKIMDKINDCLNDGATSNITIYVGNDYVENLKRILDRDKADLGISVFADGEIEKAQARISIDGFDYQIDMEELFNEIALVIDKFLSHTEKGIENER